MLKVAVHDRVPGADWFVTWSPVAQSIQDVRPSAVLAMGFCMGAELNELPLTRPLELRRPKGKRRIGPAFTMPEWTQRQLMPLGPLTERLSGQHMYQHFAQTSFCDDAAWTSHGEAPGPARRRTSELRLKMH